MKFLFSSYALVAATAFFAGVHGNIEFQGEDETCGTETYDLETNGMKLGHFYVTDRTDNWLHIEVNIEGAGSMDTLENSIPYITKVTAQVCCKDVANSCSEYNDFYPPEANTPLQNQKLEFTIMEPDCGPGIPTDFRVMAHFEEPGGINAFNNLFPETGIDLKVKFTGDAGRNDGASFIDAVFKGPNVPVALQDKTFDGYCVDQQTGMNTGVWYNAKAYSFLEVDWENYQVPPDSNIQHPENMDKVAWCINNFFPGTEYTLGEETSFEETFVLHSNHLQKAIWRILKDKQEDPTPHRIIDLVMNECLSKGQGFVPGCDDLAPVVVVPLGADGKPKQNQYLQTTFANLQIPCNDGVVGDLRAKAYCVTETMASSGGDPHFQTFGNKWFGKYCSRSRMLGNLVFLELIQSLTPVYPSFLRCSCTFDRLPWWM